MRTASASSWDAPVRGQSLKRPLATYILFLPILNPEYPHCPQIYPRDNIIGYGLRGAGHHGITVLFGDPLSCRGTLIAQALCVHIDDQCDQQNDTADQDLEEAVDLDMIEAVIEHAEHAQADDGVADTAAPAE